MAISRRKFLKWSALTSIFAGLTLNTGIFSLAQQGRPQKDSNGLFVIPEEVKNDPLFHYTRGSFLPYLNSEFRAHLGVTTIILTLVEVADCDVGLGRKLKGVARGECFVLIFRADRELPSGVDVPDLEHDALGTFPLFMGNWKNFRDPEGIYYQAVINRVGPHVLN